ncbi:MAG TPA: serine hydrolase [Gemmataceae bacterium]|nr:serine hydrolase [Gemmataceae bacterium]
MPRSRWASWQTAWTLVLGLAVPVAAPAASIDSAKVDALVKGALKAWEVPGAAVAIVRDDELVYLKGLGIKELGGHDAVTPDTVFPISSCTKAFTTTAMAMLVDEGKMDWDDPVRKHVDYFHLKDPLADANVTLRDLVTHRTGLSSHDLLWYRSPWDQKDIIRRVGLVEPSCSFRSCFQYQSIMFTTAGYAVGHASRSTWAAFVQKRIFDPLGMTGVTLTTAAAEKDPDRASGHRKDPQGKVEVVPWYRNEVPDAAASVNASARDLSKWVRFQLAGGVYKGKRLVTAESLAETHSPQIVLRLEGAAKAMNPDTLQMSYGMAWVIQDYRGHLLVSHAGAIDGFRAHITLVPRARLGIVLLNNLEQTRMNLALSNNIVDLALGLPKKDWNAYVMAQVEKEEATIRARVQERQDKRHHGTKPSRELAAYTGAYENPAYGTAVVSLADGVLVWKWNSFIGPLRHYHYDTFTMESQPLRESQVMFALGRDGNVATMKVMDAMNVEFKKVQPKRKKR